MVEAKSNPSETLPGKRPLREATPFLSGQKVHVVVRDTSNSSDAARKQASDCSSRPQSYRSDGTTRGTLADVRLSVPIYLGILFNGEAGSVCRRGTSRI